MATDEREAGNIIIVVILLLVLLSALGLIISGKGGDLLTAFFDKLRFGR